MSVPRQRPGAVIRRSAEFDAALHARAESLRLTQRPKEELADFQARAKAVRPGQGIDGRADLYRHNGAGEMLVYSAADFEDFREPRPELPANRPDGRIDLSRRTAEIRTACGCWMV